MIAHIATFPGQTPGVSAFNPHFLEALNLTHTQLTGVYMLGSFLACLPMCAVGALMDRYGNRKIMAVVYALPYPCVSTQVPSYSTIASKSGLITV